MDNFVHAVGDAVVVDNDDHAFFGPNQMIVHWN
jgi:hypothetical protein